MKISKIIDELAELKEYIGDKDLEACIANGTTNGVNVMYTNDIGGITSTSLEGEKMERQMKATMSDQEAFDKIKVKVVNLNFCESSDDLELVARADVEVTNDNSFLSINGLDLRYNDTTGNYSIVEPKTLSGVCMNELTRIAVTNAFIARYEQIKHSEEMLKKLAAATSIDRKEYCEILPAITAHFDIDNMDVHDCLKKCRLELKAAYAYIKYLEDTLDNTQSLVIEYGEKITEQKDSLLRMCARLGKMGNLAYLNAQAKLSEVYGDKEGARRAAIKKEQWKGVERKCKETVERNNRPIELTVGDKHVSPKDLGWH